jgi:signal recognition particle receptor subunit beta
LAELDEERKVLAVKIVYYGPALSGKTTNLMQLHESLSPKNRGELMMFDTRNDRTLFFDLLPMMIQTAGGLKVKLKVYTVPGQVAHDATRKAVLSRADAVAFIADSQRDQTANNFESMTNLEKNAYHVGIDFEKLPLVIQFNKRDLKNIIPKEEIAKKWKGIGVPIFLASALNNKGVKGTFTGLVKIALGSLDEKLNLRGLYGYDEEVFLKKMSEALHI